MTPELLREAVIVAGQPPSHLIADIRLDGVLQRGVCEIGDGFVVRGVRKPDNSGWTWDEESGDFVTERVAGCVTVAWKDRALARRWLEFHGMDAARFGA